MAQKTALNTVHRAFGGRLVEFAGWELPLHFGSQVEEHHAVRREAGMFDVSHMTVLDLEGRDSLAFLRILLANDIAGPGRSSKALYSCMLNERGGVVDDLMVFRRDRDRFRLVANAATRERVMAWIGRQAEPFSVAVEPRGDLAMIAVQGPEARARADGCFSAGLREAVAPLARFGSAEADGWFVSRTGYTGEDGYEILLPCPAAADFWRALASAGISPCGLGARDTLRLEAGLCLYGADMDETVSPLEAGLEWTVAFDPAERAFIGRAALEARRGRGALRRFTGLVLEDKGILRAGQRVLVPEAGEGVVTSGGYAPTLGRSIGFARLPPGNYDRCRVEIRGRSKEARITPTRFVERGKALLPL
jgi:aminomethyltransferase